MKTNKTTGIILRADGTQEAVAPANKKDFSLKEMQRIVGGYVETLYLPSNEVMVINEDGKLEGLKVNVRATEIVRGHLIQDTIVGDVLICPAKLIK